MLVLCYTASGFEGGQALRYGSLAQHGTEEEEDGSSSPHATSALQFPPRSQTLLAARTSSTAMILLSFCMIL